MEEPGVVVVVGGRTDQSILVQPVLLVFSSYSGRRDYSEASSQGSSGGISEQQRRD